MVLDLSELQEFGRLTDQGRQPSIVQGGFLILGNGNPETASQRRENGAAYVGKGAETQKARPAAGPREGRSTPAAATAGAAAYPVERGLSAVLGLGELFQYHPDACWVGGSSSSSFLLVPLGLFQTLPFRANLMLEFPSRWPPWLTGLSRGYVPFIRAWAAWATGIVVRAHHEYPDQSICAFHPGDWELGQAADWQLGRNSIEDQVGYCACWVAKVLHLCLLGWWPGLQHYPAAVRVQRSKPDEYCGCGQAKRYRECCMEADRALSTATLVLQRTVAELRYAHELRRRGLCPFAPTRF